MEHAGGYRRTQSLSGTGAGAASPACSPRPPNPRPLHDAAEGAAADLRAVRKSAEGAPGFISALSAERSARDFQPLRHAHPLFAANVEEPIRPLMNRAVMSDRTPTRR